MRYGIPEEFDPIRFIYKKGGYIYTIFEFGDGWAVRRIHESKQRKASCVQFRTNTGWKSCGCDYSVTKKYDSLDNVKLMLEGEYPEDKMALGWV